MVRVRSMLLAAVCAFAISLGANSGAGAAVFHPATAGLTGWTATPGYIDSWYSSLANDDIGEQSPANVEAVLESASWLNIALTFVQGGPCATNGVVCTSGNTGTYTGPGANVFGIHFDNKFIALLYTTGITSFFITGLPNGVSNIYAFCSLNSCIGGGSGNDPVPLPAPFILMGTVLAGTYLVGRWRRRRGQVPAFAA